MTQNRQKILRRRCFDSQRRLRDRVDEMEAAGVERLPRNPGRWLAVKVVAENRVAGGGEMDAKLMCTSCDGAELDQ